MPMLEDIRREKFCQLYATSGKKAEAAREAGFSDKGPHVIANRLLKEVSVLNRIAELQNEAMKPLGIDRDRIISELAHISTDDISNYLEFRTEEYRIDTKDDGTPVMGSRVFVAVKDSNTIDTRNIQEISIGKDGQFRFKLYPKDAALVNLGKHLGMFKDASEVDVNVMVSFSGDDAIPD